MFCVYRKCVLYTHKKVNDKYRLNFVQWVRFFFTRLFVWNARNGNLVRIFKLGWNRCYKAFQTSCNLFKRDHWTKVNSLSVQLYWMHNKWSVFVLLLNLHMVESVRFDNEKVDIASKQSLLFLLWIQNEDETFCSYKKLIQEVR